MASHPDAPERPFVGLRPFETHESLVFFGRQRQVVELLERLHRTRFVGVVGSSGSGKSSLIQAGLIPALRAGFLVGDRDRWVVATMRPGDDPWPPFAQALASAHRALGSEIDSHAILETVESSGVTGITSLLGPALDRADANLLLLVDQFEEIFRRDPARSSGRQAEEDADFVSVMLGLSQQRAASVFVVLTMRTDHLDDCDGFFGLPEALNESQYLVPRLSRDEVQVAIEGPVRLFGRKVAPRLSDRLLNDLGSQHDQLPILQHALLRMWDRLVERGEDVMDLVHYEEVGTLTSALSRHAEEALDGLGPADLGACKAIFQALAETDHANRRVRRWQRLRDLQELTGLHPAELVRLLERFRCGGRSFLRFSGDAARPDTLVDISHESLIRRWGRLEGWVEEETRHKAAYLRIKGAAESWEAHTGSLLRDPGLEQALRWWREFQPSPTWARRYGGRFEAAELFLRASEREREREQAQESERRELKVRAALMRRTLRVAVAGFAVASALALFAARQWRRAESGELAARSLTALRVDPEGSLRLAVDAAETAGTPASDGALREALPATTVRQLWSVPLPFASAVAFSPDGRRLAAATAEGDHRGRVGIWDVGTGRLLSSLCGHEVGATRWVPGGNRLLLGLADGGVLLWRPREGPGSLGPGPEDVTTLVAGGEMGLLDMDLSPDGRELALVSAAGGLSVYEVSFDPGDGRAAARVKPPPPGISSHAAEAISGVAYGPDEPRLAVAGSGGSVTLLQAGSGGLVCQTERRRAEFVRVAFSEAALGLVAAADLDDNLRAWRTDCSGQAVFLGHRDTPMDLLFAGKGDYLVSVANDGSMRLWDPKGGRELFGRRMNRYDSGRATFRYAFKRVAVDRSADSSKAARIRLATLGAEDDTPAKSSLMLWDIASRRQVEEIESATGAEATADPGRSGDLLRRARELRVEPRHLEDQRPACSW